MSRLHILLAVSLSLVVLVTARPGSGVPAAHAEGCPGVAFNLSLVVDRSGSIESTDMAQIRSFLSPLVSSFVFGADGVAANIISFSSSASVTQTLTMSQSLTLNAISGMVSTGGSTNIPSGWYLARRDILQSALLRTSLPTVMVLITDGNSTLNHLAEGRTWTLADVGAWANEPGNTLIAIGAGGGVSAATLLAAAGGRQDRVFAAGFDNLPLLVAGVREAICTAVVTDCPAGSYSATGQTPCTPCAAGSYQPLTGQTECLRAPSGSYVPGSGAIAATPCPTGTYQPDEGATTCIDALPGYFVPVEGAVEPTLCPAGSYQPAAGSDSCLPAARGHYVDISGATAQTACPAGSYQPLIGQTVCLLADPGYYVASSGTAQQEPCPEGTVSLFSGATECLPPGEALTGAIEAFLGDDPGIAGALITLAERIDAATTAGARLGAITAFTHLVEAQRGLTLTDAEADTLLAALDDL